jgi:hypothetical protein
MKKAIKTKKKPVIKKTPKPKVKKAVKPEKKPAVRKTAKSTVKKVIKPVINLVQPHNTGLPTGTGKQPADHRRPLIVFPK